VVGWAERVWELRTTPVLPAEYAGRAPVRVWGKPLELSQDQDVHVYKESVADKRIFQKV